MFTKVKEEVEAPVVEITAKEAKRAAINDARNIVREAVKKAVIDKVTELTLAVATLTLAVGTGRGARSEGKPRFTAVGAVLALFDEVAVGQSVEDIIIFRGLGYGRFKMKNIIADCIKKAKSPEERIWMKENAPADPMKPVTYSIEAIGDMPEGWDGYKMAVKEEV